jgi:concentrative nucleoside transporter, CNT family
VNLVMGLVGMATLLAIAVIFSSNRRAINLRTVIGAFLIQLGIGAYVLFTQQGRQNLDGFQAWYPTSSLTVKRALSSFLAVW